jgi:hypothetical protein
MKTSRRVGVVSLATLSACFLAGIVAHTVAPEWTRTAGLDFWNLPAARREQQREDQRTREIEASAEDLCQRVAADNTVAQAVIDDRMEWTVAVDQILEINRNYVGFLISLETRFFPLKDPRELAARYLWEKIETKLARDASRRNEVMSRIRTR